MKKLIPHGDDFALIITRKALEKAGIDVNHAFDIIFDQTKTLIKKRAPMKKPAVKKQPVKKIKSMNANIDAVIKQHFNALKKLADL